MIFRRLNVSVSDSGRYDRTEARAHAKNCRLALALQVKMQHTERAGFKGV